MQRIEKQDYYLNIADAVSKRSTCLRKHYGAVIVNNDEIISTGYNGAPRNVESCYDTNICIRDNLNIPSGENYEMCMAVHAEANAIISASRKSMIGSTLYLCGRDASTGKLISTMPCIMCIRLIINAGIKYVITSTDNGIHKINENLTKYSPQVFDVNDWIKCFYNVVANNQYAKLNEKKLVSSSE